MRKDIGGVLFSASDIVNFLACRALTALDCVNLNTRLSVAEEDPTLKLLQEKGFAHESAFLKSLRDQGRKIAEIPSNAPPKHRAQLTTEAMQTGADAIFQAAFLQPPWTGDADFLIRCETPSKLGAFSYEVYDTKLARKVSPRFMVQLAFYNQLLAKIQGMLGKKVHIVLGDNTTQDFHASEIDGYVSLAKRRFLSYAQEVQPLARLDDAWRHAAVPYPAPCEKCDKCRWRDICDEKRLADDHLSQVANIRKSQIAKLETAGITTLAALAKVPGEMPMRKISGMEKAIFAKLAHQAALQHDEKSSGKASFALLPPYDQAVAPLTIEAAGLSQLPVPDPGDLFFDMEGNPLDVGGLEYLFGVAFSEEGKTSFKAFWAHTRAEEKVAFEAFVDFALERLKRHPRAHIYHYASYEVSAMRRLASRHATREKEVDDLLRQDRFIDLFKVVRESLRISKDSYSIKKVESFYRADRGGEVKKGDQSIVVYEEWRISKDPALLKGIEDYNKEDCFSALQLRDWLLSIAPAWIGAKSSGRGPAIAAGEPPRPRSDKALQEEEERAAWERQLEPFALGTRKSNIAAAEVFGLIGQLLAFHVREKKPGWWSIFDRQGAELEDLIEDEEIIAACEVQSSSTLGGKMTVTFRYPEQHHRFEKEESIRLLSSPLNSGKVSEINEQHRLVTVVFSKAAQLRAAEHLVMHSDIPTSTLGKAITRFAKALIDGRPKYKALLDYLNRRPPDIQGVAAGQDLLAGKAANVDNIWGIVSRMNETTLYIQGPPGAGKTYTGAHLIARLIQSGKRVAICSNSHKAINHLLGAAHDVLTKAGYRPLAMKKYSNEKDKSDRPGVKNVKKDDEIIAAGRSVQLAGGVAWTFCKEDLDQQFDYLFVDEAGQVSLANLIAMGVCAKNLVLLGDQMQLGQPIQAAHPGRSGESALDYFLDGIATIPPERGVFLDKTFRLHPDVCRFVSDCFYESRLQPDQRTANQRLVLAAGHSPILKAAGLVLHPVVHRGNSQRSAEEAAEIKTLIEELVRQRYVDHEGREHPMTINDVLVVAPYNAQVKQLTKTLPEGSRVGTVDKFQGQEAQVVIVSLTSSSIEDASRGMEFLLNRNRLNVAISRSKCLSILVGSPLLMECSAKSPEDVSRLNVLGRAVLDSSS